MSSGHYIKRCSRCNTIIGQCRCLSCDKIIEWGICESCKGKGPAQKESGTQNTTQNNASIKLPTLEEVKSDLKYRHRKTRHMPSGYWPGVRACYNSIIRQLHT